MSLIQTLYYNEKFGYINGVETINTKNNLPTLLDPVLTFDTDMTDSELAKIILEAFDKAQNTPFIERQESYKFWEVAGVKSFKTFSKRFNCIDLEVKGDICLVRKLKQIPSTGGYTLDPEFQLKFQMNDLLENISRIKEILTGKIDESSEKQSFKTLENNLVSYQELPDGYDDLGDGHTDAYQMYGDAANNRNLLAFMIDSGYESFGEADVKEAFERFWGPLESYDYTLSDDSMLYAKVHALSRQYEIQSYFFKDGETYLDVQYQLDRLQTSEERRRAIQADFERLIQSIAIKEIE